jgi:O-antigen/teichoic acid export membrane protein
MRNEIVALPQNKDERIKKNFLFILLSNIVSLLVGLGSSFFIPKILQIDSYAVYKLFTLYSSYVGFFHFGFVDGIYLKYGGCDYGELKQSTFRTFFRFFLFLEFSASLALCLFIFVKQVDYLILLLVALDLLLANCNTYFSTIAQITTRFKTVSFGSFLLSVFKLLAILVFFKLSTISDALASPYIYISFFLLAEGCELVFFIIQFRDLVFGPGTPIASLKTEIFGLFKTGVPLLLSNIFTILLFDSNTQIVSLGFEKNEFAVYSFSYNIFSVVSTFATAISLVLFPVLKRKNTETLLSQYPSYLEQLSVIFSFFLCFFPLICQFIQWFLPDYSGSMETIRVCFPAIIIYNLLLILVHNYYKALGKELTYTFLFGLSAIVGIGIEILVFFTNKSTYAVSVAYFSAYCLAFGVLSVFASKNLLHRWLFRPIAFLFSDFIAYFLITRYVDNFLLCFLLLLSTFFLSYVVFFPRKVQAITKMLFAKIMFFFGNVSKSFTKNITVSVSAKESIYRLLLPILFVSCFAFGVFSADLSKYHATAKTFERLQTENSLFCDVSFSSSKDNISFDYAASQKLALNFRDSSKTFYVFDSCNVSYSSFGSDTWCIIGSAIAQENVSDYFSLPLLYDNPLPLGVDRSAMWITEELAKSILSTEGETGSDYQCLIGRSLSLAQSGLAENMTFYINNIISNLTLSPLLQRFSGKVAFINYFSKTNLVPDFLSLYYEGSDTIKEVGSIIDFLASNYTNFVITEENYPVVSAQPIAISDIFLLKDFYSYRNKVVTLIAFLSFLLMVFYHALVIRRSCTHQTLVGIKTRSFWYSLSLFLLFSLLYFILAYSIKIYNCNVLLNPWCPFISFFCFFASNLTFWVPRRKR